jgi:hypothetical protein
MDNIWLIAAIRMRMALVKSMTTERKISLKETDIRTLTSTLMIVERLLY